MAAAAVQDEQFNKILQCSICIDVFTDPRTLPCLHTFCFKCIADWCKNTQPGAEVACPECREECVIPNGGVGGLKKNFFIANLLSMNEIKKKAGDPCETCASEDKKVSEMFCLQCEQSYCESCSKFHLRMKNCKSHKLVHLDELQSRDDINNKQLPTFCDKHVDKVVELYCLDDDVVCCLMCCVLDHRSHHCEETKNIANQFRSGKCKQDLQTALNNVNEKLKILNSRKLSFYDQVKSVENEICEEADKRIKLIMKHKLELVSLLHKIRTSHEQEIDKVSQELTKAKALLSTFTDYCDELLKKGSDVDICREKNSLCRRTEELVSMKDLGNSLGKLRVGNVIFFPSSTTLEDSKSVLGEIATDNPQLLSTVRKPPTLSNGCYRRGVEGVALLDKCLCVVYQSCNKVQVFDCEDNFKKIKDIQIGEVCPRDMVGCSVTSQLFVIDWNNDRNIWRVNVNTGVCDVFIKLGRSANLSLVENCLLVTSHDSLLMYDIHSGQRTNNISYIEEMKKHRVYHAIESNRDSFFVIHGQSDGKVTVSEIDWEGRVIRVFDSKEQVVFSHLALDSVGRLLVADYNNKRVVLLDEHLQFSRILLDRKQLDDEEPLRLSYNKNNNRLAVGLGNGHVKIFDCILY